MRIRRATPEEKARYDGVHPLYGYALSWKPPLKMEIEYLGEGKDEPNYEVLAPAGKIFAEGVHTLLATDLKELKERLEINPLENDKEEQ